MGGAKQTQNQTERATGSRSLTLLKASDTNTEHCTSHSAEADHKVEQGCNVNMGERCSRVINNMLLLGVSHWHGSYTPRSFMARLTMS